MINIGDCHATIGIDTYSLASMRRNIGMEEGEFDILFQTISEVFLLVKKMQLLVTNGENF